jgi:hypothetical protein
MVVPRVRSRTSISISISLAASVVFTSRTMPNVLPTTPVI